MGWEVGNKVVLLLRTRKDAPSDVQSPLFFIYHKQNYDMELVQVFELSFEFRLHACEALLHEAQCSWCNMVYSKCLHKMTLNERE